MMKKAILILSTILFALILMKGCGSSSESGSEDDSFVLPLGVLDIDVAVSSGASQTL
jgi:uncharacterized lipoprotein NlpE involved in copper resistance